MTAFHASPLVRHLYGHYYQGEQSASESALTSSHWVRFGRETVVEMDQGGQILSMRGAGFGKLDRSQGVIKTTLDRLTMASYVLLLPAPRQLLRVMRVGRQVTHSARLRFNIEAFRQVSSVRLICSYLAREKIAPTDVLIIGDGYGFCANLLKRLFPDCRLALSWIWDERCSFRR